MKKVVYALGQSIFTAAVWLFTAFSFLTHFLLVLLVYPFCKDSEATAQRLTQPFFSVAFFLFGFKMTVKGVENIPENKHFILISNHQSHMDIVVLLKALKTKLSFISKKELLAVPILGWDIHLLGHVAIDRSNPKTSLLELARVEKLIEKGLSVVLFPEGTRSLDGELGDFKKGAFMMAANTGVSVLPCTIVGTGTILNKRSLMMKPGAITVYIDKPISVKKAETKIEAKQTAQELLKQSNEVIQSRLQQHR